MCCDILVYISLKNILYVVVVVGNCSENIFYLLIYIFTFTYLLTMTIYEFEHFKERHLLTLKKG